MTSKAKVLIIGIDGLDAGLLSRFKGDLPNFAELMRKWASFRMHSVFPPDSPTAWASIFTGLNPAKHGIVSFKDPFSRSRVGDYFDKVQNIKGKTFWDFAGKYGKKCCIVFPHLAYPPWPVNGILVSRTTEVDIKKFDIKTYPAELALGCDPLELKPVTSFPRNIGEVIQPTKQLVLNEAEFGMRLFERSDWDVFFIYFSSLDNIEHIFWMALDRRHPAYAEMNQYHETISDFYGFYDQHVIGKFMKAAASDAAIIVISDHGHGLRPLNLVRLNELLARSDLQKTKIKSRNLLDLNYLKEFAKKKMTDIINERRTVAKLASRFLSMFPQSLGLYTGSSPIDWSNTLAYLSDSSAGLKTYSYAGVRVKNDVEPLVYENIRKSIIEILKHIEDPATSEKILEWAIRREELYDGPYISRYPDVVFKLKDDWGVDWGTGSSLFGKSITHKLFSGTHRQDSAVLLLHHPDGLRCRTDKPKLTDLTPTILQLLGLDDLDSYGPFDGRSIISSA